MREETLKLMLALAIAAAKMDAVATELTDAANILEGHPVADAMRDLARRRRVDALMYQGRLAGLTAQYTEWYDKTN